MPVSAEARLDARRVTWIDRDAITASREQAERDYASFLPIGSLAPGSPFLFQERALAHCHIDGVAVSVPAKQMPADIIGGILIDVDACAAKVELYKRSGAKERGYISLATLVRRGVVARYNAPERKPGEAALPTLPSGGQKKPGVITAIIRCLREANEKSPTTKDAILKELVELFPDRAPAAMKSTISSQVPSGLKTEKNLRCQTNGNGGWWLD